MMSGNYPGSLSTPTVVDSLLYSLSGMGDIVCLKTTTGEEVWSLNMLNDMKGDLVPYGFSQSLLVDGDLVYCAPSGKQITSLPSTGLPGKLSGHALHLAKPHVVHQFWWNGVTGKLL